MHDGIGHMVHPLAWAGTPRQAHPPWAGTPQAGNPLPDMVNEQAVRILLECIFVVVAFYIEVGINMIFIFPL